MANNLKNFVGEKIGRRTILKRGKTNKFGAVHWICKCECGKESEVRASHLNAGEAKSCVCLSNEMKTKHGMSSVLEYGVWSAMKRRCYAKADPDYKNYGGRGIKVCNRWLHSFGHFIADMGRKPSKEHSLERMNNDGDYKPSNCRWATRIEQANNLRRTRFVTIGKQTKTFSQWTRDIGITRGCLTNRLRRNWPEDLLLIPAERWRGGSRRKWYPAATP